MARNDRRDRLENAAIRGLLGLILAVPYRWRVPMMGWVVSRVVAPLAGWRKRIRANLAHVLPDLPQAEVRRLERAVPDNVGRMLIEVYSGTEFKSRVADTPLNGPGLPAFRTARAEGRPVLLVTAHFGNYDVLRTALFASGYPLGALYREMRNPHFNAHYVGMLKSIGEPVFPATRQGITALVRYLADGGTIGILTDVFSDKGLPVTFFGKTAPAAASTADWALKYDALVIPIYGVRQPDGLSFETYLDTPVPLTDPQTIMQGLNDSLERMVRRHMDQWFWIHRRWKPERQAELARAAEAEATAAAGGS
ncbi:lauroyl acyltransferase [Rhodobacteraceae bacterium CCMM004]|nr:lauroyl acyltransferase [Rhodobacteraceae bacterium CCMM004]